MSRSGAKCPCCESFMTMADLRHSRPEQRGFIPTAVVIQGQGNKAYRGPLADELSCAQISAEALQAVYQDIPLGLPDEQIERNGPGASYGLNIMMMVRTFVRRFDC